MTDQQARQLPSSLRATEVLKTLGEMTSGSTFPPIDLLKLAISRGMQEDQVKGAQAMMLNHLQVIEGMPEAKQAEYLLGEETNLDPGSAPDDVLDELTGMLHLRMTETAEGYPPVRTF